MTAANWTRLKEKPAFADQALRFPDELPWFTPYVPAGTAFDLWHRSLRSGCPQPPMIESVDRWAAQAPFDMWAVWCAQSQHTRGRVPFEARQAALATLADYDLAVVLRLHDYSAETPAQLLALATQACRLDEEQCDRLAQHLVENGREEEAVRTFDRWIDRARDRVHVSNGVLWLVRYDYDRGLRTRALDIAQMAAEVYSAAGLETLADLYDRMGRADEAEPLYERIADRYDGSDWLLGAFYMRQAQRTGDVEYEARARPLLMRKRFPKGIERVTLADLKSVPRDGLVFRRFGARAEQIGLQEHDVLIAIDGVRVRNLDQYNTALRFNNDARMTVIVWREGRYQELPLVAPQRWFGVVAGNYRPGS